MGRSNGSARDIPISLTARSALITPCSTKLGRQVVICAGCSTFIAYGRFVTFIWWCLIGGRDASMRCLMNWANLIPIIG